MTIPVKKKAIIYIRVRFIRIQCNYSCTKDAKKSSAESFNREFLFFKIISWSFFPLNYLLTTTKECGTNIKVKLIQTYIHTF